MATRAAPVPARYLRANDGPSPGSGRRSPRQGHSAPISGKHRPSARDGPQERDVPTTPGSGFKIHVSSIPTPTSGHSKSDRQKGAVRGHNSHQVQANGGHRTNPERVPSSAIPKKEQVKPVSAKRNMRDSGQGVDNSYANESRQPLKNKMVTQGPKNSRTATNVHTKPKGTGSKIPTPSSASKQLTKNELSDLMMMMDQLDERADKDSGDVSAMKDGSHPSSPSPSARRSATRSRSRSPRDWSPPAARRSATHSRSRSPESRGRKATAKEERTWRHGDENTGPLGLGGISRDERDERARQPRPKVEITDMDALLGQIEPPDVNGRAPKRKVNMFDRASEEKGMMDLMDLAKGFDPSPKVTKKPAPKTAPKPKLSKSELDELIKVIDSQEIPDLPSKDKNDEVTDTANSTHTWRTGDEDEERMNNLRTKLRDRTAASQPPDWAIDDLIMNKRNSGSAIEKEDKSKDTVRSKASDEPAKPCNKNTNDEIPHSLSDFENFITDSLVTPSSNRRPVNQSNHSSDKHRPAKSSGVDTTSSKPSAEAVARPARVSTTVSAPPARTAPSRSSGSGRRSWSSPKPASVNTADTPEPDFFSDIITAEVSPTSASPSSRLRARSPKSSPRPERPDQHTAPKSQHIPPKPAADEDRRRPHKIDRGYQAYSRDAESLQRDQRSTERSVSPGTMRSVSPKKSRSVSPEKSRSVSPAKSRSTSPDKPASPVSGPKSRGFATKQNYIQATQKPWPRDKHPAARRKSSRTPSPSKREPTAVQAEPRARSPYNLRSRNRRSRTPPLEEERVRSPSPVIERKRVPAEQKPYRKPQQEEPKCETLRRRETPSPSREENSWGKSERHHEESEQEVVFRRRKTEDSTDSKPKRKSLSLAGMSNPDRDSGSARSLRSLIAATEAMEKQMFTSSRTWRNWSDT